jgi:hypothetical protein
MKNSLPNFILLTLILISACTTSEKTMSDNGLEKDYSSALRKLESGNASSKQIAVLSTALTEIINQQTALKDSLQQIGNLENTDKSYQINQYLLDKIFPALPYIDKSYKATLDKLKIEEQELQTFLQTTYFEQGKSNLNTAMSENDKAKSKMAYLEFEKSQKYGGNKMVLDSLKKVSLDHSIMIYNLRIKVPSDRKYLIQLEDRFQEIEKNNIKFKQIYFNQNDKKVDCTIWIEFDKLVRTLHDQQYSQTYQKRVRTGSTTQRNEDGTEREIAVFNTVSGTVSKNTKVKTFQWNIYIFIESTSNNCNLGSSQFPEILTSEALEIDISGDERAVPEQYQNFNPEPMLSDMDLMDELIDRIYRKIEFNVL